jgi:ATP-dependent protease ClpP protease subunit
VLIIQGSIQSSTNTVANAVLDYNVTGPGDYYILLTGPGGSTTAGMDIINHMAYLEATKGARFHCVVVGYARSMHNFFWDKCKYRYAHTGSVVMWHKIKYEITQPSTFNQAELEYVLKEITRQNDYLFWSQCANLGMTRDQYSAYEDIDITVEKLQALSPNYFKMISGLRFVD